MAASLLRLPLDSGLALSEMDCSLFATKRIAPALCPSDASRQWKAGFQKGQLPQGALERRRPPSKLRGVRAAGFKSLFGQKSVVEKKKELPKPEVPKKTFETWVPTVQTFFPSNVKFPPAYQIGTLLAFTLSVYVVGNVTSEVLSKMEAVPFLPQLESLLGVLITTQFVSNFLTADSGKARLESLVEGIVEKVGGQDLEEGDEAGPRMLEVQLRSLLDSQVPVSQGSQTENAKATLLKQTLVTSLMSFILERESKGRRINSVLRKDVDEERARVAKLKQAVALYAEKEASSLAELARLTSSTQALRAERDAALSSIEELNARLASTTGQLESVSADRSNMENLNSELKSRVAAIVAENKRLSGDVSTLEEAKEKAASELRAAEEAADVMLSNNRALQGRVQKLEAEKEEVMFALGLARKRLVEAEHDLERAQAQAQDDLKRLRNSLDDTPSAELAAVREQLERTLRGSQSDVAALEKSLETLSAEKAALEAKLRDADAARASGAEDLRIQIEDLEDALDEARRERAAAKSRVQSLEKAQDDARNEIDELETELEDAVQQLAAQGVRHRAEMESRVAGYEKELEARKSQIEALVAELEEVQRKKKGAEEAVAVAEAKLVELEENRRVEVDGLKAQIAALQTEDGRANAAALELEKRWKELEEREKDGGGEKDAEAAALAGELVGAQEKRHSAERQLAEAQAALAAMAAIRKEEMEALRAEVEAWQVAEGAARDLVKELEGQLKDGPGVNASVAAYEQVLQAKQGQIHTLEARLADDAAGYKSAIAEKEGLLSELRAKWEGAQAERDGAVQSLTDVQTRLAEVEKLAAVLVSELEARVAGLLVAEAQSKTAIADLEKRLAEVKLAGTLELAAASADFEARLRAKEEHIETMTGRLETIKAEKEDISKMLALAHEELASAKTGTPEEFQALQTELLAVAESESKSRGQVETLERRLTSMLEEVSEGRKAAEVASAAQKEAIQCLEIELGALREQKAEMAEKVAQTKAALAAQETAFGTELEALRKSLETLERSEAGARERAATLEKSVLGVDKDKQALINEAEEARATAGKLRKEVDALRASKEAELSRARKEMNASRGKLAAASAQLAAAHEGNKAQQAQISALEGRVAEGMVTYEEAQETMEELGRALEAVTEERTQLRRRAEERDRRDGEEKSVIWAELEESRRLREGLAQEMVAAQAKLAEAEVTATTRVAELQAEVAEMKKQEGSAHAEAEQLRAQLTAVTAGAEEMLKEVTAEYASGMESKEREVCDLLDSLRTLKAEKAGTSEELKSVRRRVGELEAAAKGDVAALLARVIQLEEERQEADEALEGARARLAEVDGALAQQKELAAADVARLDELLTSLRAEGQGLASSNATLESKLARLAEEREKQLAVVSRFEAQLAGNESDQETSLSLIAELRSEIEAAQRKATEGQESANGQFTELQQRLNGAGATAISTLAPTTPRLRGRPASSQPRGPKRATSPVKTPAVVAGSPTPSDDNGADGGLSHELKSKLVAYNHEVREQFVDLTKTAKEQSEGVQKLIDALVTQGATESWARAYVIRSMSYERAKARKQR